MIIFTAAYLIITLYVNIFTVYFIPSLHVKHLHCIFYTFTPCKTFSLYILYLHSLEHAFTTYLILVHSGKHIHDMLWETSSLHSLENVFTTSWYSCILGPCTLANIMMVLANYIICVLLET